MGNIMKKCLFLLLVIIHPIFADNIVTPDTMPARARASAESSYDAVVLSMAVWGVGLAVGIGVLTALIKHSTSSSHSH